MRDFTIHSQTLQRHFQKSDFASKIWLVEPDDKDNIIMESQRIATTGFKTVSLQFNKINGKAVFRLASLPQALLTRHVSESIRQITNVHQSDRNSIIRSILQLLSEGISFNVIKMDIKSFYENINVENTIKSLKSDPVFSRQSIFVLESFFSALKRQHILGLPRGIGLSATLAEYVMRGFDREVSTYPNIRYYNRYVDDAIIITTSDIDPEKFLDDAKNILPQGLNFNERKTKIYKFSNYSKKSSTHAEHTINFLGYKITVDEICYKNKKFLREISIDIADSKVSRTKRRLAKIFLDYNNKGNFDDLLNRIKIITSNYGYEDESSGMWRYSGLRYNYGLINPQQSDALKSLDKFMINTLTSKHPNNRIRPNISSSQRHQLLGLRFSTGFTKNRFFTFKRDHLIHLIGCWAYA
ncbi:MAG: antiviral reverse transcriptase Drt3a [Zymomonas mobilis]|uniref:antiviral reverse transcriptase Drt3a n=1 Tax=Zymomonas mobilis TaxID=542 RepID=UPI0039ECE602